MFRSGVPYPVLTGDPPCPEVVRRDLMTEPSRSTLYFPLESQPNRGSFSRSYGFSKRKTRTKLKGERSLRFSDPSPQTHYEGPWTLFREGTRPRGEGVEII